MNENQMSFFKEPELLEGWEVTIPASVLQSTIQKAVRRGRADIAVRAVASMWAQGEKSRIKLVRRMPVIVLEDAVLTPNYDELVEVMKRASRKSYQEEWADLMLLLDIVAKMANSEWTDGWGWDKSNLPIGDEHDVNRLGGREAALIGAMRLRGKYGGMRDDVSRQYHMALVWARRFAEGGGWGMIEKAYDGVPGFEGELDGLTPLTKADLREFPYGLDSHCTGVLKILIKKDEVKRAVQDYKHLDWLVWNVDSGLNLKKVLQTGDSFLYEDYTPDDRAVWDYIRKEYRSLQLWWIDKKC